MLVSAVIRGRIGLCGLVSHNLALMDSALPRVFGRCTTLFQMDLMSLAA